MEQLDDVAKSTLMAANVSEEVLHTLTREDLRDLFPGPENFLRRKAVWRACHGDLDEIAGREDSNLRGSCTFLNASPLPETSTPVKECHIHVKYETPEKVVKVSFPEYVLHTDTELEQVRKQYFELAKKGEEKNFQMSKELRCRLIRNTMTSMIAILRAKGDRETDRYPSKPEVTAMAKRIVQYYPMLQDQGSKKSSWVTVYSQLNKRLQNVRSPQKRNEGGGLPKKRRLEPPSDSSESTVILDCSSEGSTSAFLSSTESAYKQADGLEADSSTAMVKQCNSSQSSAKKPANTNTDSDSPATMAKHYRTLLDLYKKKNPNHESVSQLLDLEFVARRAFIDSDTIREEDRHEKILKAYPCFKDIEHVMGELRRILDKDNSHYIDQIKGRWHDFCQNQQLFGIWRRIIKPPMGIDKVEQAVKILSVLPSLFPSASGPPKKLGNASEALVHVLKEKEDPGAYLKKRPLSCPVLIVSPSNCLLAVGDMPVTTFPKDEVTNGALYLMAYYYALHLTYPKCIATLLSVLQTEVLLDAIHEQDLTPSYKKGLVDWKAFVDQ